MSCLDYKLGVRNSSDYVGDFEYLADNSTGSTEH